MPRTCVIRATPTPDCKKLIQHTEKTILKHLQACAEEAELGARMERGNLKASVAVFRLALDSELVFAGETGANDAFNRIGVETSLL